jgi:hypothetical protein
MGGWAVSWSDVPGHVSYVLIALSYWMTNVFWLRIIAVIGLVFEIFYFRMSSGDMHTGIGWDAIFIIINLYQIFRLVYDERRLRYMKELHLLSQGAFASLTREQLAQLVKVGSWRTLEPGTQVTRESLRAGRLRICTVGLWSANSLSCQVTRHRQQSLHSASRAPLFLKWKSYAKLFGLTIWWLQPLIGWSDVI